MLSILRGNLMLYKIITEDAWARSQSSDRILLSDFDSTFVHFAEEEDVERIGKDFFPHDSSLVVLTVDPSLLPGRLVKEKNPGGKKEYYHLYDGYVPRSSVVSHRTLSQCMKAVVVREYGGIEMLSYTEISMPNPGPKDFLVKVHASGINPVDVKICSGHLSEVIPVSFPFIPGVDVSGEIVARGAEVQSDLQLGEEVFFFTPLNLGGGQAEFCAVAAELVARKPHSLSHVEAASLPVVGLTVLQTLRDYASLSAGQKVLIHAGAGGVGSFAIQYAKHCGAKVFTTARQQNHAYVKSLGADVVIDHETEDFVEICQQAGGMDVVLETLGGLIYPRSIQATRDGGFVPCIVNPPDADSKALAEKHLITTDFILLTGKSSDLDTISSLVEQKIIRPTVSKELSLEEIQEAHRQLESGRTVGKWVFSIR